MFCIDLDELEVFKNKFFLLSYNKANLFNFRDKDHLQQNEAHAVKQNIINYIKQNGVDDEKIGKILLFTNVKTAGYIFNPVSFYYVFDKENKPYCAVVEVCNTFGELKPYLIENEYFNDNIFKKSTTKYFYVSPFIAHDASFNFHLSIPIKNGWKVTIDDTDEAGLIIKTGINAKRIKLTDAALLVYFVSIPLVTVKIIASIHWEALKLWTKKIGYFRKKDYTELQRGVYRPHLTLINSNTTYGNSYQEPQRTEAVA